MNGEDRKQIHIEVTKRLDDKIGFIKDGLESLTNVITEHTKTSQRYRDKIIKNEIHIEWNSWGTRLMLAGFVLYLVAIIVGTSIATQKSNLQAKEISCQESTN